MTVEQKIETTAKMVAQEVRDHVRDHFTPSSLDSLEDLKRIVEAKVTAAIVSMKGQYACFECGNAVEVERVRCSACVRSDQDPER